MNRISSKSTYFWKVFFPLMVIIILLIATVELHSENKIVFYSFLGIDLLLLPLYFFTIFNAKKVSFNNQYLIISNRNKEEKIPINRILEVNEIWMTPKMAAITLKEPSSFGTKIKYIQKTKFIRKGTNHPDIELLFETLKNKAESDLNESRKSKGKLFKLFAD